LNPGIIKSSCKETFNLGIEAINGDFINDSGSLSGVIKSESIKGKSIGIFPFWADLDDMIFACIVEKGWSRWLRIGD